MKLFKDTQHDIDSCMDVWENLYKKVYPPFWDQYFDFSILDDKETSLNCKRWYIKLKNDIDVKAKYPKFKMAGDCIFNFNEKKIKILKTYVSSDEGIELLDYCKEHHHSFENFAFMPITGGMNNQKGRGLDRPDIHVNEIDRYFSGTSTNIFSHALGENKAALEWYLSLFNRDILNYFKYVYLIDDELFVKEKFIPFANANTVIIDENGTIEYMKLAIDFWGKRTV